MKREGQFWLAHVAAIKREGISANAYAKREGISLPVVYYWQRKLKAASEVRNAADTAGGIVQLRIADNSIGTPGPRDCTLMLTSGIRLEMTALPTPEWLARPARAMQGAY